ncbi:hypothetical protein CK203_063511 [Vitis vinifera]|uniref:Uncharacterized protein n=1 Tax=Vitis vinifera TaxID=29760 RepID=A0A438G647_VITVI|nr:hypothetical protein CK203_063511 [Vitis vinifera]
MSTWWRSALQIQLLGNVWRTSKCHWTIQAQQQCFVWKYYNSSWRNHPNFSGSQEHLSNKPAQPSQQASSLEQAIVNLSKVRDVKALITLRSGKKVELTPKPHVEEGRRRRREEEEIKGKKKYSEGKEDHDSTVNANPEKVLIKEIHDWRKIVEKALLDLGASVNLLPYSVYKQLGLGELKPTSITLSLADRSVKIPRGIIEDVLVQAFLATSNAIINCRNGLMQLTFGNMTLGAQYLLYVQKAITPKEEEGPEEVCIIDTLVEEHCNQKMQDKLNESLGDLEEGLPEPSDVLATLQGWRRREEILPLFNKEEA